MRYIIILISYQQLLRKKAAEELKKEQEKKAAERKKIITERTGTRKSLDGANEGNHLMTFGFLFHLEIYHD